jgi:hypothetical protein
MDRKISKDWLIRRVAGRAKFTYADVELILDTIRDIIYELIESEYIHLTGMKEKKNYQFLMWTGLFSLYFKKFSEYVGYDSGEKRIFPETYRVGIKPSRNFINIVTGKKKINDE